jgi:hypothetical protein
MDVSVAPHEDQRHVLGPDEHEAFYFVFCSQDGQVYGGLRLLFGRETLLELASVQIGERKGLHQKSQPWPAIDAPTPQVFGPDVTLDCVEPWQRWHARVECASEKGLPPFAMDLTFRATTPPARFNFGPSYQQVQQDGRLSGSVQVGAERWQGELLCYRDHSWGHRPMGAAKGWAILDIPERLYAVIITLPNDQRVWFGRAMAADGRSVPLVAPELTTDSIQDPRAGVEKWTFEHLIPPSVSYLGQGGEEAVRSTPRPGDLFKDEIGPVLFTSPTGERIVGFMERAEAIAS